MKKIKELLTERSSYEPIAEMEKVLLQRREKGNLAGYLMLISVFFQVVFMVVEKGRNLNWGVLVEWNTWFSQPGQILVWALMLGAILAYVGYNYTGIALKASKEPFRYTFWIGEFVCLNEGEEWDKANIGLKSCKELLRHDLMQMLNDRIKRFTLLENAGETKGVAFSKRDYSHIHVSGHYALKWGESKTPYLQVAAKVRIGPEDRPSILVAPILYPLDRPEEFTSTGYQQLLERVFSGVASMIYTQIEEDIASKISLFPTSYLRATALCHEAEDFARSNTIDGYERAIGLYHKSLFHFQKLGVNLSFVSKLTRLKWLALFYPKNQLQAWSKAVLGYAKYRIFRNQMASLSGQTANPLYDLPDLLERVREVMEQLYMKTNGIKELSKRSFLKQAQGITKALSELGPNDTQRSPQKTLFETYVVIALAHRFLGSMDRSEEMLSWAAATMPGSLWQHPLYLLAKGLMQPDTHKSLVHFHHVVDLAPDFQMAQWFLAQELEKEFRRKDELDANRASTVIQAYERVLHLNAGNIATIGAIGHLYWLLSLNDENLRFAKEKLIMGTEVKSLHSETYIGDLNFRLARIAAERGEFHLCRERYLEAAGIDPSVGSFLPPTASRSFQSDYDNINIAMIHRFRRYLDKVSEMTLIEPQGDKKGFSEKTKNFANAFALNDYGNACLRYFHFHGDEEYLLCSIHAYKKAGALYPEMAVIWYNLQNALGWKGQWEEVGKCMEKARKFAPNWSLAAIQSSDEWFRTEEGSLQFHLNTAYNSFQGWVQQHPENLFPTYDHSMDSWCSSLGNYQREFDQKFLVPLKKIYAYSKNAALYEEKSDYGNALIELLKKIQKIPWHSIDVEDVQVLQELLKVITYANKPVLLTEALGLGEHLLKVIPQDHFILSTQINLLSKCIFYRLFQQLTEAEKQINAHSRLQKYLKPFLQVWIETSIKDLMNQKYKLMEANISFIPHLITEYGEQNLPHETRKTWESILTTFKETKRGTLLLEFDMLLIQSFEVLNGLLWKLLNHSQPNLSHYFKLFYNYQTRMENLTEYWLHADHGGFLSLYWYFFSRGRFLPMEVEGIKESFFTLDSGKAAVSCGNLLKSFYVINRQDSTLEQAIKFYQQAKREAKDQHNVNFNEQMGHFHLYAHQGRWTLARQSLMNSMQGKSELEAILQEYASKILMEIGLDYQKTKDYGNALHYLEYAATYSPNDADLHYRIYKIIKENLTQEPKLVKKAVYALKMAMELDPIYDTYEWQVELQRLSMRSKTDTLNAENQFAPLTVEFDPGLEMYILNNKTLQLNDQLLGKLEAYRAAFKDSWGFSFPPILFRYSIYDNNVDTGYFFVLQEIPENFYLTNPDLNFILFDHNKLLPDGFDKHKVMGLQMCGQQSILWLDPSEEEDFLRLGYHLYDSLDHLLINLEHFLSMHLLEIFSFQSMMEVCRQSHKGPLREIADDAVLMKRFWECGRALLAERIPLLEIEELAEVFLKQPGSQSLTQTISNLRRCPVLKSHFFAISSKGQGIALSEEVELAFLRKITFADQKDNASLTFPTAEYQNLIQPFKEKFGELASPFILVKNEQIRPHIKSLLQLEHPDVSVFATSELSEDIKASTYIIQIP